MRERTTIIIAHRLSTVINADRIVVMDQGQVILGGPVRTVITMKMLVCLISSELYQRLARLQFQTQRVRERELRQPQKTPLSAGFR